MSSAAANEPVGAQTGVGSESAGLASRPPADLEFDEVSKLYSTGSGPAIKSLSLYVAAGEICCLVGPSGGGKTTALKMINRLIEPTSGDIRIGGKSVLSLPATQLRRDIGYVFQQVGLLPHMTVAGNIGITPRLLRWDKRRIEQRTAELLELVGLGQDFGGRYPTQLSGGQQQRVGLARALAVDPPLMLMDEPFGALDPITRGRLQLEFLRLQREIRKTVVFVTHDIDEAIVMGDKVAVLREGGVLAQFGTPDEILGSPADDYVADFLGHDRGLKRLSLRRIGDLELAPSDEAGDSTLPTVPSETSLRDALATMFETESRRLAVSGHGRLLGTIDLDRLHQAMCSDSSEGARKGAQHR
jgi:osmoprotectant transport system ATP-binding protein